MYRLPEELSHATGQGPFRGKIRHKKRETGIPGNIFFSRHVSGQRPGAIKASTLKVPRWQLVGEMVQDQVAPMDSSFAPMTQSSACTRDTPGSSVEGVAIRYLVLLASQILPCVDICYFSFICILSPFLPFAFLHSPLFTSHPPWPLSFGHIFPRICTSVLTHIHNGRSTLTQAPQTSPLHIRRCSGRSWSSVHFLPSTKHSRSRGPGSATTWLPRRKAGAPQLSSN